MNDRKLETIEAILMLSMAIFFVLTIIAIFREQNINYEIEKMKIEKGIYERKEVQFNIERNEKPN